MLTRCPTVLHIWISEMAIGSGNGLSPVRRHAITWTNADHVSVLTLGTPFIEIESKKKTQALKKTLLKYRLQDIRYFVEGTITYYFLFCTYQNSIQHLSLPYIIPQYAIMIFVGLCATSNYLWHGKVITAHRVPCRVITYAQTLAGRTHAHLGWHTRPRQNGHRFANDILNAFSWSKPFDFQTFHWNMFLGV